MSNLVELVAVALFVKRSSREACHHTYFCNVSFFNHYGNRVLKDKYADETTFIGMVILTSYDLVYFNRYMICEMMLDRDNIYMIT